MTQQSHIITNHIEYWVSRSADVLSVTSQDLEFIPPGKSYPGIKYLQYSPRAPIKDLTGLKAFPCVKTLILKMGWQNDEPYCLNGIAELPELEILRIFDSCPNNLEGIEFCSMLSELHIDDHPVLGEDPARNDGTRFLDLAVLQGHPALTTVMLKCPADVESLDWSTLPSLDNLSLLRCLLPGNDLEFLRNVSLGSLTCYACGLESIEGLCTANLHYLDLEHNRFREKPSVDLPIDCTFTFTQYGI